MLKQILFSALPLMTAVVPIQASAQDLGDEAANITLPGISFTRSLNGAAENTKVGNDKLTLTSAARRDNFRDPDGKLSSNTAPVLLTEIDNGKPFTLAAKITPTFVETYDAGALFKNDYPAKLWLGISAQSPMGNGTSATFEDLSLTSTSITDFRLGT